MLRLLGLVLWLLVAPGVLRAEEPVTASRELLLGAWTGRGVLSIAELKQDPKFAGLNDAQFDRAVTLLRKEADGIAMTFAFAADGSVSGEATIPGLGASEGKKTGAYEIVEAQKERIVVRVVEPTAEKPAEKPAGKPAEKPAGKAAAERVTTFTFRFATKDQMTLEIDNKSTPRGLAIVFERQRRAGGR